MKQDVGAECLAALMVLDRSLEPIPEPFRMQPDIEFIVCFDEYVRFLRTLPTGTPLLYFPTDKLQRFVETRDEQSLTKAFYIDTALAVCKELFFAEQYGKGAAVIRHGFYGCHDTKSIVVEDNTVLALCHILKEKGFPLSSDISSANARHWRYACKLVQDASKAPTRWVENP